MNAPSVAAGPAGPRSARGVAIRCEGVVVIYPATGRDMGDVVALRGVDLDVEAGEFVALLGPSGSGKSTVLGLLAGALRPSAGRVLIGAHDVGRMPPRALGRLRGSLVATILQNPAHNLLPYATVAQNVEFGAPGRSGDRAAELLDRLGLAHLAPAVAGRLSGGEQQRVAIAAAVASGADLVLADEPTSQLDATGRAEVVDLLEQVNREFGATVVLVTHDPFVADRSARTVTIRDGRVGAEGRHGREYAVIGRDGALQLPPDVLEHFPPGTLLEVRRHDDGIGLTVRPDEAP
jgi:putative ABC transport system ATP-binding protein